VPHDRPLRIVLAEDSTLLREGLVELLHRFGHTVTSAVGDAPALLAAVDHDRPDVVVVDIRMPPGFTDEGLRAAVALRSSHPELPIVVLSQYVEPTYAAELLDGDRRSAGLGYLLKDRIGHVEEFAAAVERVAGGAMVIDPELVRQLFARRRDPLTRLTPRELDVLGLMAHGRSNAAIARALVVTEAAVAKHIASILAKLDLPPAEDDNRRVLAVLAYLNGQG
jgi:DNA-binding NarL/FixJ family response regulator